MVVADVPTGGIVCGFGSSAALALKENKQNAKI